jgi:Domain of unknown function (DUF4864)
MSAIPRFLILAFALIAMIQVARADSIPETEAQSMREAIEAQLAAFSADDADKAFSFASESIQKTFGDAQRFIEVVKASYAVVYRPASVLFLKPERVADETVQGVQMTDEEGRLWLAAYRMQRQPDSSWRIDGCLLRLLKGSST